MPARTHAHDLSVFQGLPTEVLSRLLDDLERRSYPAGTVLVGEGDRTNEIYIAQSGSAEVVISDVNGTEHRVGTIVPGGSVGEISLLTGQPAVATVRAVADLDVLVMSESEFARVAENHPAVYRNLGAVLAERLARTDRLVVGKKEGKLTLLLSDGAPTLLGYALSCSIAWHTRERTLLVVIDNDPPAELAEMATTSAEPPWRSGRAKGEVGVDLMVVAPERSFSQESIPATIEALFGVFPNILIQTPSAQAPEVADARKVRLAGTGPSAPAAPDGLLRIRAWVDGAVPSRPGFDALVDVPPLGDEARSELRTGTLSIRSDAGRELGWAARDCAGLKVGLALGAGSLRGYAHVGVLEAIKREGIPLDYVAGTSIGAAVAALAVGGWTPAEIGEVLDELSKRLFRLTVPFRSFISNRGLRGHIRELAEDTRIEELPIPLALIAADIATQQELVLRRGLAWQAILASVSIPGIFPAQKLGPHVAVDGGVLNPVPVNVVAGMGADVVLAVKLGGGSIPPEHELDVMKAKGRPPSAIAVLMRSIETMQSRIAVEPGESATTIMIVPKLDTEGTKLRKFIEGRRYIADGEAAVEAALPRIVAALPWVKR